jgi:uncharacterized protein
VIVVDTSGALALINLHDPDHARALRAVAGQALVVPALALAPTADAVARAGPRILRRFLAGFLDGTTLLDPGDTALPRIVDLLHRYRPLRLGFAQAAVIASAERTGGRILTFERRQLAVIARAEPVSLLP